MPEQPLPKMARIDWAKADHFKTFVKLWALQHSHDVIGFPTGMFESLSPKVKACLKELPEDEVKAILDAHAQAEAKANSKLISLRG